MAEVDPRWNCSFCAADNHPLADHCHLCLTLKSTQPVPQSIQPRWACSFCPATDNHPLADWCSACGNPKRNPIPVELEAKRPHIASSAPVSPAGIPAPSSQPTRSGLASATTSSASASSAPPASLRPSSTSPAQPAAASPSASVLPAPVSPSPTSASQSNRSVPTSAFAPAQPTVASMAQPSRPISPQPPQPAQPPRTLSSQPASSTPVFRSVSPVLPDGAVPVFASIPIPVSSDPSIASAVSFLSVVPADAPAEPVDCCVCAEELTEATKCMIAPDCFPHCTTCMSEWIKSQVSDGGAENLKCSCPQKHKIPYIIWRSLEKRGLLAGREQDRIRSSLRRISIGSNLITCPDCNEQYSVDPNQSTYRCRNPQCSIKDLDICIKHNRKHERIQINHEQKVAVGFDQLLNLPRCCPMCVQEQGGGAKTRAVVQEIVDAFVDRCPHCKAALGEPASFASCLSLKCSHCPMDVCGFCYLYASDRVSTHHHVRHCSSNPRANYFVESEAVWRGLMRERRRGIADQIIAAAPNLSIVERQSIDVEVSKLLAM